MTKDEAEKNLISAIKSAEEAGVFKKDIREQNFGNSLFDTIYGYGASSANADYDIAFEIHTGIDASDGPTAAALEVKKVIEGLGGKWQKTNTAPEDEPVLILIPVIVPLDGNAIISTSTVEIAQKHNGVWSKVGENGKQPIAWCPIPPIPDHIE